MEDENKLNEEDQLNDYVKFIADFSKTIYEVEVKREERSRRQSSQIQAAFAFTIAALFVLLQIIIENTSLPTVIIIWAFSTVCFLLVVSLVCAICVQLPHNRRSFPDIETMMKRYGENYKSFLTPAQRYKYLASSYAQIQKGVTERANKNMFLIKLSMCFYLGAIALCAMWFVVMLCVAFC